MKIRPQWLQTLLNLIQNNNIDPTTIGRIYLGTESAVDAAKPTATYAVGTVEKMLSSKFGQRCFKNCDVVDLTFACIGAVDALENCLDWVRVHPEKKLLLLLQMLQNMNLDHQENIPRELVQFQCLLLQNLIS